MPSFAFASIDGETAAVADSTQLLHTTSTTKAGLTATANIVQGNRGTVRAGREAGGVVCQEGKQEGLYCFGGVQGGVVFCRYRTLLGFFPFGNCDLFLRGRKSRK